MTIIAVFHVYDIFASRWFGRYSQDRDKGTLTIPQKTFADELVRKFQAVFEQSVPLRVGVKLEKNDGVDVVSQIQRVGCHPEKNYFTQWPIPLVIC